MTTGTTRSVLGVVLVSYNSVDVILDCLESLCAAAVGDGTTLRIVVVDNASSDNVMGAVGEWLAGRTVYLPPVDLPFPHVPMHKPLPEGQVALIPTGVNGGFAAGVNIGLAHLFADSAISRVWILNPDSVIPKGTPAAFASYDAGPFALIGGRVFYYDRPEIIQIDGGTINLWTGVTGNLNQYATVASAKPPLASACDFITGASMVVSRTFWEKVGPMPEDYFLYYEEVDWALQRGELPLVLVPAAIVYHRAGTAIGSPSVGRRASPFSLYFKHRARLRFVRRHLPRSIVTAWLYTLAKVAQFALRGWWADVAAVCRGALDAPPPKQVRERLDPAAAKLAFAHK